MSVHELTFSDEADVLIALYGVDVEAVARTAVHHAIERAAGAELVDAAGLQRQAKLREISDVLATRAPAVRG